MVSFETFTKSLAARGRDPFITVQKRGTIAMNAAAFGLLDSTVAVELLYDRDDHVLGLRGCDSALEHAMFVRPATRSPNGPYVVSAMAFLRHYELEHTESRRFPARLLRDVLCVELGGPSQVVSRRPVTRRRPRPG